MSKEELIKKYLKKNQKFSSSMNNVTMRKVMIFAPHALCNYVYGYKINRHLIRELNNMFIMMIISGMIIGVSTAIICMSGGDDE